MIIFNFNPPNMGIIYTLHFFPNSKAKDEKKDPFKGPSPIFDCAQIFLNNKRNSNTNTLYLTKVIMRGGGTRSPLAQGLLINIICRRVYDFMLFIFSKKVFMEIFKSLNEHLWNVTCHIFIFYYFRNGFHFTKQKTIYTSNKEGKAILFDFLFLLKKQNIVQWNSAITSSAITRPRL